MVSNQQSIKEIITINDFLDNHNNFLNINLESGYYLNEELRSKTIPNKIYPFLQFAKEEEALEISKIFNEVYDGTYPYKDMENIQEIKKMIKSQNFHWILFKILPNETIGCVRYDLDFQNKSGTFHGFAIKRRYQKIVDPVDISIACMISILNMYSKNIFLWSCEIRTGHTKSQYMARFLGLKPIGFLPNKDIFFKKVESEILYIIYDKKAIEDYRSKDSPRILRQIIDSYYYSSKRYHLGNPIIENPTLRFNRNEIANYKRKIKKIVEKDNLGYEYIKISIKNEDSFIQLYHNPSIKVFEKIRYKIHNLIQLYVLVQEVKNLILSLNIRFCEFYVTAYNPMYQKVFLNAGFKPTGYIPSWKFDNKTNEFKDYILFTFNREKINTNIKLLPECITFLNNIKILKKSSLEEIFEQSLNFSNDF